MPLHITQLFDGSILHFLNQAAQRSWLFDTVMVFISSDPVVSGGLAMAFFWWAWFRCSPRQRSDRTVLSSGLAVSCVALVVARTLAALLPFRARPCFNTELHLRAPFGTTQYYHGMVHWNSFPSDHAVLYLSLATCIFLVSRKAGALAFSHAIVIVCFPLVYLGKHYPTDILGGSVLGIGMGALSAVRAIRQRIADLPLQLLDKSPASFYTCFFLCSCLFATNFDAVRKIGFYAFHAIFGSGRAQF